MTATARCMLLCLSVLCGLCRSSMGDETAEGIPKADLVLKVYQSHMPFNGEPVFLKVELRNEAETPRLLWLGSERKLARGGYWFLELSRSRNGRFQQAQLTRREEASIGSRQGEAYVLQPGKSVWDYITLWFEAFDPADKSKPRVLFNEKGDYWCWVSVSIRSGEDGNYQRVKTAEPLLVTAGGYPDGYDVFVMGLVPLIEDDSFVPYSKRQKLDDLYEQLKNTIYGKYVAWLRISCFANDGEGHEVLEHEAAEAEKEVATLTRMIDVVTKKYGKNEDVPPVRDALVAEGFIHLYRRERDQARYVLADVEKRFFAWTPGMRKLRMWLKPTGDEVRVSSDEKASTSATGSSASSGPI